jgi:hypothetical protein
MMRTLIYAASVTLAIATFNSTAYGSRPTTAGNIPHIVSTVQFPETKARNVRHTIRLEIPAGSSAISQLQFSVPPGLTVKNDITVRDQSGKKVDANTSVSDNTVTIDFPQTVQPGTRLNINMNKVLIYGIASGWLYRVDAKLVGNNVGIPIGFARVHTYQ